MPTRRAQVWALMIVGQNEEPFLEAALRSVDWVDGYSVVNTDPGNAVGQENARIVHETVPLDKLALQPLQMDKFDFARARNLALDAIPRDAYALIVDSDDVHWPSFRDLVWGAIIDGYDIIGAHYWHHCVHKDLWHSQPHRWLCFKVGPGVRFRNTQGNVHEELEHPHANPVVLPDYTYGHYGYIKSAREVASRWEFYRSLGAPIHEYDATQPDKALDDWPRICHPFVGEHPPAVREVLEGYPAAPLPSGFGHTGPRVGLVLTTWNDADNLRPCLQSLRHTTEPFMLAVVDNQSADESLTLVEQFREQADIATFTVARDGDDGGPGWSLATALNLGFGVFMAEPTIEYIGWIHPDHTFEWPEWLAELVNAMDTHPEYAKLGASEAGNQQHDPRAGNSQCYIVRCSALEKVGLFDEGYEACGGAEDWDHNRRLLEVGQVMIWPLSVVRHKAMQTRQRHDNVEAARRNMDHYHGKWGTWDPAV